MNKVYLVERAYDYEGISVSGIYSSLEKANAGFISTITQDAKIGYPCDSYYLVEAILDTTKQPSVIKSFFSNSVLNTMWDIAHEDEDFDYEDLINTYVVNARGE